MKIDILALAFSMTTFFFMFFMLPHIFRRIKYCEGKDKNGRKRITDRRKSESCTCVCTEKAYFRSKIVFGLKLLMRA
jgi:hypothetical protein